MFSSIFRPVRFALLLLLFCPFVSASTVSAQEAGLPEGWTSADVSDDLVVQVQGGAGIGADDFAIAYSDELTTALEELLLFLNVANVEQPVTIEIYSDISAYEVAVGAIGRVELDGQIAAADPPSATIALPIDSFRSLTSLEAENQ